MTEIRFAKTQTDLEAALNIRRTVFIEEFNVPEDIELDEFDSIDSRCEHILVLHKNAPVGTARCNIVSEGKLKIQRFCFLPEYRKNGFGKMLLNFIETEFTKRGYSYFFLEAKFSVHTFYEKCGYKKVGDVFPEANVPHIKMEKTL